MRRHVVVFVMVSGPTGQERPRRVRSRVAWGSRQEARRYAMAVCHAIPGIKGWHLGRPRRAA